MNRRVPLIVIYSGKPFLVQELEEIVDDHLRHMVESTIPYVCAGRRILLNRTIFYIICQDTVAPDPSGISVVPSSLSAPNQCCASRIVTLRLCQ